MEHKTCLKSKIYGGYPQKQGGNLKLFQFDRK